MPTTTVTVSDLEELERWAKELTQELSPRDGRATVLALSGELGVGKTAFVGKLLAAYGVEGPVTSPTYTIESVYELPVGPFARAYHLDAYRLESAEDLTALDFSARLGDPENLVVVEWAEVVAAALPTETIHIDFSFAADDTREITLSYE